MAKLNITAEMWERILRKSPALLPDNPTAMGWSAREIKEQLYRFVLDEKDSIRAVIEMIAASGISEEDVKNLIGEALTGAGIDEARVNELITEALKDFTPPEGGGSIGSISLVDDGEGNFTIVTTGGGTVELVGDGEGNFTLIAN